MLYLEKCRIYTLFQDDLSLKKPRKPPTTFEFVNNQSVSCFLDVQGLELVFSLKEMPIGATQTIPFFAWANQNCLYISTTYDPSDFYFDSKM